MGHLRDLVGFLKDNSDWLVKFAQPDLVDRVKYGQTAGRPATVSREALAAILELDRILVMGSIENTAAEGQTAAHSFIGAKGALLCNVAPSPGLLSRRRPMRNANKTAYSRACS